MWYNRQKKSGAPRAGKGRTMAKLRNGEIAFDIQEEPLLWRDKKRILGLAISFTRYELTQSRLIVKMGLLNTREEELRLFRVRDISAQETLVDRLFGVGSILLHTTDATSPTLLVRHIKNHNKVKELLSAQVEEARMKNRVRSMEVSDNACEDDLCDDHDVD